MCPLVCRGARLGIVDAVGLLLRRCHAVAGQVYRFLTCAPTLSGPGGSESSVLSLMFSRLWLFRIDLSVIAPADSALCGIFSRL